MKLNIDDFSNISQEISSLIKSDKNNS